MNGMTGKKKNQPVDIILLSSIYIRKPWDHTS